MKIPIRYLKGIGICLGLAILLLGAVAILDAYREIRKIGVGTIWHIPSRIYSHELTITPGMDTERIGLDGRLERLRYRYAQNVLAPGEYKWDEHGLTIFLHPFEYASRKAEAALVRLNVSGSKITRIISIDEARDIESVVLEPECIAEIFDEKFEDRTIVTLDECPAFLLDALISTEDRRFYEHWGMDVRSLIRAALANIKAGGITEGGSTITQQLIKNLFLTQKRTFGRKFKEMWMAFIMEAVYSKPEILEMYINEIYMGRRGYSGIYGLGRAARLFFDKDISDIDLAEAALLAGIIRAPNRYSPYAYPADALARRNTVLELMKDSRMIEPGLFEEARNKPIRVIPIEPTLKHAPYFIDHVLARIQDQYPATRLAKGGYRIFTTLDMNMQQTAQTLLTHGLKSKDDGIEGAVIINDPLAGDILAMVGGKDYASSQFNRCTQIRRHIGSLIKPILYYTALRRGYTLSSFIDDSPITVTLEDGTLWEPENFDKISHGRIMIRDALIHSYNQATVRMGMDLGLHSIAAEIRDILPGIFVKENPSLFLGALDCSPLEVTMLFSAFANQGYSIGPSCIKAIVNENGTVLRQDIDGRGEQVFDPAAVYLINSALMEVVTSGTARSAQMYGISDGICGKTGTTNDLRDSWFVGFTPDVVVTVWLGNDEFKPIGLTGASGAMPIASMILARIAKTDTWNVPDDIIFCSIDRSNGKLAGRWNSNSMKVPYIKGTQPTDVSDVGVPKVLKFFRSIFKDKDGDH
ncbi:MAG: PBP1A family penicillin-binding protein [Deltaproteobacteria bacterium]|nr:PBP1A family penicillin-binding protein [Deltaproteobacteria bacterium]